MNCAQRAHMRLFAVSFLIAACGATQVPQTDSQHDELTVAATMGPQSFTHGTVSSSRALTFAFTGRAGDTVAPDVWPTGPSVLQPTLVLLGPKGTNGHRSQIAAGEARGADPRHLAIDGFQLPQSGSYLIVVGAASGSAGGQFTVRLWMQSSHLPRQEGSQVDLTLQPSPSHRCAAGLCLARRRRGSVHAHGEGQEPGRHGVWLPGGVERVAERHRRNAGIRRLIH